MSMNLWNGVTLPDIPADVLAEYPYTIIVSETDETATTYGLALLTQPFVMVSKDITSYDYDMLYQTTTCDWISYVETDGSWTQLSSGTNTQIECPIGTVDTITYAPLWSNHDIYTATAQATASTEIYFPVYQEINGVWLPKLPTEFANSYPYAVIVKMEMAYTDAYKELYPTATDTLIYALLLYPNEIGYSYDSIEEAHIVQPSESLGGYSCVMRSEEGVMTTNWSEPDEVVVGEDVSFPIATVTTTYYTLTHTLHWTNHDIFDESGEVYMSGTGLVEPPENYIVTRQSLVYLARQARKITGNIIPITADEAIAVFADFEALENAEGMVF